MKYRISAENTEQHLFKIQLFTQKNADSSLRLEIPRWRPGRYENASNPLKMAGFAAKDSQGKPLPFQRISTHAFEIETAQAGEICFEYLFFAAEKNAGSSYLDSSLIYINFINLLIFNPLEISNPISIEMEIPGDWNIACSMKREGNRFLAKDFHEAVDAPLLSAPNLHHTDYTCAGSHFHIWMWGDSNADLEKIKQDFEKFTRAQIQLFGGFPVAEYHFLFLILPVAFYHGVEHQASTVIVLGPGSALMEKSYDDFLGISSHELFHTWNVKAIRPAEMQPYDYTREIYSKLHYITEGVTTWYGDFMLLKSGVWDLDRFLREFHDSNPGRFYTNGGGARVSLETASFESWVNGYQDGVPNHKISFYAKGALVAFLLDQEIREKSGGKAHLDTVMRAMYERFGKTGIGYTAEDFWTLAETAAGSSLAGFRNDYISGTRELTEGMEKAADRLGLEWKISPEAYGKSFALWGFTFTNSGGRNIVSNVFPGGPAERAGITKEDEIIAVENRKCDGNLNDILGLFAGQESIRLHFFSQGFLKSADLKIQGRENLPLFSLKRNSETTAEQKKNYSEWLSA